MAWAHVGDLASDGWASVEVKVPYCLWAFPETVLRVSDTLGTVVHVGTGSAGLWVK